MTFKIWNRKWNTQFTIQKHNLISIRKYPISVIFIGTIVLILLAAVSAPALVKKAPKSSDLIKNEAFPLEPISGLDEARSQILYYNQIDPQNEYNKCLKLFKLARLYFFLGEEGDKAAKKNNFEKGRDFAFQLTKEWPDRVEGYYWLALNLCGLAREVGPKQGFKLLPRIVKLLEIAHSLDKTYDQAGPDRVLGRVYSKAPSWPLSVGDDNKSIKHLAAAVDIAPENSTNHLFLAEVLFHKQKEKEAIQELDKVLNASRHAMWNKGLEQDHQEAQELKKKLEIAKKSSGAFFPGAVSGE